MQLLIRAAAATSVLLAAAAIDAQAVPMNGDYTVGGASPSFATCADAIAALEANGIDGAVRFHLRPGTYEAAGQPIIDMQQPIAGVSPTETISFRPDAGAGGTVDNVILQISSGASGATDALLAYIRSDYVRVENLSFVFADTSVMGQFGEHMVVFDTAPGSNPEVDGVRVTGCRFTGATINSRVHHAIEINGHNYDVVIRDNAIDGATEPIGMPPGNSIYVSYRTIIENNVLTGMRRYLTGGSSEVGNAIDFGRSFDAIIRNNHLDYTGGGSGQFAISLTGPANALIERNVIIGPSSGNGTGTGDFFAGIYVFGTGSHVPRGGTIVNNMITRVRTRLSYPIRVWSDNFLVAHNTAIGWPRFVNSGFTGPLWLDGTNCQVMNNIFIEYDDHVSRVFAMVIQDTVGNVIDHNVVYSASPNLVRAENTPYASLIAWQGTGFDVNSVSLVPTFVDDASDLHLDGCSIADPALRGAGMSQVSQDFDLEARNPLEPFMGADETAGVLPEYFGSPVHYTTGMDPFNMTAADLDQDLDIDFALTASPPGGPDGVRLLMNNGDGTFAAPQFIPFVSQPRVVKAGHLNNDSFIDLIVSSEIRDSLVVRFGTGPGTFGPIVRVDNVVAITDFDLVDYDADNDTDILMLVSPPVDSGYVNVRINDGAGTFTWNNVAAAGQSVDDLEIADLDNDTFPDLVISDATSNSELLVLRNLGVSVPGVSLGFSAPDVYPGVWSTAAAPRLMIERFDADAYPDIVVGDALSLDSLVLFRNNGDGTFGAREPFFVHDTRTYRVTTALDFEGDGDLDIATANNTEDLHLLLNDGAAGFDRKDVCLDGAVMLSEFPFVVLSEPLDGDGLPDLAVLTGADSVDVFVNGNGALVSVIEPSPVMRPGIELYQNYPNPARSKTSIAFRLPRTMTIRLDVYNVAGQRVATLTQGRRAAGLHVVQLDDRRLRSGAYFYRLSGEGLSSSKKLMLVR